MSNNQLFFSMVGVLVALATIFKGYLDAKTDPIAQQVKQLVDYMVLHQGKIATVEKRTKKLG